MHPKKGGISTAEFPRAGGDCPESWAVMPSCGKWQPSAASRPSPGQKTEQADPRGIATKGHFGGVSRWINKESFRVEIDPPHPDFCTG